MGQIPRSPVPQNVFLVFYEYDSNSIVIKTSIMNLTDLIV